jgi:glycosyltransferase involved in cell wall biosynthesis
LKSVNIVILIRTLQPGGAEKQSVLLAKALKNDFNVTLVVQRGEYTEDKYINILNENSIRYVLIKGNVFKRSVLLYQLLKSENIQIVFSYLTSDNFWSAILGKLAGVKHLVGGVRSNFLPKQKFLITKLLNHWFQDYTIFNNHAGYSEFIQQGFKKEKSVIINNCIDEVPPFINRNESKNIKLLTVARFIEGKDYLTAIKSFQYFLNNLCPSDLNVEYIMIGHGEQEEIIKQWLNEYNVDDSVSIYVNPPNLLDYYKQSDIYLCTSVYEGFSNSIMEAMMYSLPVIATDVGDNKNLVLDGSTGYITPTKDPVEIAEKINLLIQSYKVRLEMGKAGNKRVGDEFSLQRFKEKYIELIDRMV